MYHFHTILFLYVYAQVVCVLCVEVRGKFGVLYPQVLCCFGSSYWAWHSPIQSCCLGSISINLSVFTSLDLQLQRHATVPSFLTWVLISGLRFQVYRASAFLYLWDISLVPHVSMFVTVCLSFWKTSEQIFGTSILKIGCNRNIWKPHL